MTNRILVVFGILVFCSVNVTAGTLDLSLSEYSVKGDLIQVIDEDENGYAAVSIGGLYNDKEETVLGSLALHVMGKISALAGVQLGVGLKGYVLSSDEEEILAGGFGGLIRLEQMFVPQLSLAGSIFYCPDILTTLEANRMMESEVKIEYELIPRARVYAAYTNMRADMELSGDRELDEGFRLGLHLAF